MPVIAQSRLNALESVITYRAVSLNNPDTQGLIPEKVLDFILRFTDNFFDIARNNSDSIQYKELKAYRARDEAFHLDYDIWEDAFIRTLRQARPISRDR